MNEELKHIDDYFKNSLDAYEVNPPKGIWNIIEEDLNKSEKKHKFLVFYQVAAAITFLIILGTGYLYYNKLNKSVITENKQIILKEAQNNQSAIISKNDQSNLLSAENQLSENPTLIKSNSTSSKNVISEEMQSDYIANNNLVLNENKNEEKISLLTPLQYKIRNSAITNNKIHLSEQYIKAKLNEMFNNYEEENIAYDNSTVWEIGGQFSPMIAKRDIKEKQADIYSYSNTLNESEMLAYSGGINVNINTDKRFSIQSGIYYSHMGQQINDIGVYSYGSDAELSVVENYRNSGKINTSSGQLQTEPGTNYFVDNNQAFDYADPGRTDNTTEISYDLFPEENTSPDQPKYNGLVINDRVINAVKNYSDDQFVNISSLDQSINQTQLNPSGNLIKTYGYIEIPIILKYKVIESKLDINVLGGISTDILISNQLFYYTVDDQRNSIPETTDFSTLNYSSIVGLGFDYPILNNFTLNFEPSFKYFINSINNDEFISSHPYTFAFFTGIRYKF